MVKNFNGFAKNSDLQLKNKKLKTPTLFFGQPIGGTPNPWELFKVEGILLNAFHILERSNKLSLIQKCKSLNHFLKTNSKTAIMIDSGGFLFQKKEIMDYDCRKVLDLYRKTKPDIGVVLDHPFSPTISEEDNVNIRWKKTIQNTRIMLSEEKEVVIFPVIHGYTEDRIKKSYQEIKSIIEETNSFQNKRIIIGIGSLVPLMMTSRGAFKGKSRIVDLVLTLRTLLPDAHLHAFGIGGTTTALILFYLGVDSLDSVSWRLKAAKGALQLPGVGDRFIKPPKGRLTLSKIEEELLAKCNCPICKDMKLEERKYLLGPKAPANFENRAIHNAWTYQEEIYECRKAIKEQRFEEFIRKRLEKSLMKSMFQYAENKFKNIKIDLYN